MLTSIVILIFTGGIVLGGLLATGWFLARRGASAGAEAETKTRLQIALEQAEALRAHNLTLQQDAATLQARLATLDADLRHEKEKTAFLEEAKRQMGDTFKALSQDVLHTNRESFLTLAQEKFGQLHKQSESELEKRQSAIRELVEPVAKSLEKMDGKIAELEKAREGAYGELREHLKTMKQDQDKLRGETATLVQALRSPATRGQWGELQLKRTLEMAGMVENVHYEQQVSVSTADGDQRPDVIVRLPGGQCIIIDAKTPIEAFLDAMKDGASEEERSAALERHARHVRDHMKKLGAKSYWDKFNTPEFVVMFLPGESYFSAALEKDPALIEAGVASKVIPATPTTLISLLKAVHYGWRQEKLAENAREISDLGKELYNRLAAFGDHMQKLGRNLGTAINSYNSAVGSLERSVLPQARKFQTLEAVSDHRDIAPLDQLEHMPRQLQIQEMAGKDESTDTAA